MRRSLGRPAGAGQLDIPALLSRLYQTNRCQTATLELWTPWDKTLEESIAKEAKWVIQSCEYLLPLLKQFPTSTKEQGDSIDVVAG